MQAFQAGSIDMVDWDIPQAYLSSWNNCAGTTPIGPNCNGQITTSKYNALDMFQIDMNENGSRVASQSGFRQAMGYLVDRQNIVLNIAGGFAQPVCSGASAGQEGSASCQSLGYPGPYGDYNPTKALQLLVMSIADGGPGFGYDSLTGFLESPQLSTAPAGFPCGKTGTSSNGSPDANGFCTNPIIFMIRSDDPLRLGAGQAMANIMHNLPNQFCNKANGNVNPIPPCPSGSVLITVCPAAPCKLDVILNVAAKPALARFFQHAPWNSWDLYTGGWYLDLLAADDLPFLYTSSFAPAADCGLWAGDFPLNYGGFCNAAFDNDAYAILNAPNVTAANDAVGKAQRVAWGYDASIGKITGLEPTVPMYFHEAYKAAWLHDVGAGLCANGSAVGSSGCPSPTYAQRACWQNFIGNEVGVGLNIYQTLISWFDDNCGGNTVGHKSYVGNSSAVFDWGFINPIEFLNIMQSTFVWDVQAMAQTYDTMLGRNAANPSELIPFLCTDFSTGTYFNTPNAAPATYYACHLRKDLFWNDGVPLTAQDIAFSTDYIAENQAPLYASNVAKLCGPNFTSTPFYSATNCGDGVQIVNNPEGTQTIVFYFDNRSAISPILVGTSLPIIPKHVYCNSWTAPAAGQLGPGVLGNPNCLFPDMTTLPDSGFTGLGCGVTCPAFPHLPANDCPGGVCAGTTADLPSYLQGLGLTNWQVGSGPYMISACGGSSCANTILLKENPYWHDGTRMASPASGDVADPSGLRGGLELQPDLNRDGVVNSQDLAIANANHSGNATDWRYSADFRQGTTVLYGTTLTSPFTTATVSTISGGSAKSGTSPSPSPSTTYNIDPYDDLNLNSTGGTGVSITIIDSKGGTVVSGATTLNKQDLPRGGTINFGAFTSAPSVTVIAKTGDLLEDIAVPSSVCGTGCTPVVASSFTGWTQTSTDTYIIQTLIREGIRLGLCVASGSDPCASGGITWPPASGSVTNKNGYLPSGVVGSLTYLWPDSSGTSGIPDDTVNVNDLIYVNNHQFVSVTDASGNLITTSPYNADVTHDGLINIDDLVTTLTRQFSAPAGVNP